MNSVSDANSSDRKRIRVSSLLLRPLSYAFPMIGTLSIGRDRHSKTIRISVVGQWLLLFFDVPRDRLTRGFFHLLIVVRGTRNILSVARPSRCDLTPRSLSLDAQPCVSQRFHSRGKKRSSATGDLTGTQRNPEARGS